MQGFADQTIPGILSQQFSGRGENGGPPEK